MSVMYIFVFIQDREVRVTPLSHIELMPSCLFVIGLEGRLLKRFYGLRKKKAWQMGTEKQVKQQ